MISPYIDIDSTWTLFLDRDGVINVKRELDYVKKWEEFIFLEGALEAIKVFSGIFGKIIVVTNQRGIGRKLMTEEDLEEIHNNMLRAVEEEGGNIHQIYYCPDLEEEDLRGWRKPKPGMALEARKDYPEIDFSRSLIIGDSISDMKFGKNAGMYSIYLSDQEIDIQHKEIIDAQIPSLVYYANSLKEKTYTGK